MSSNDNLAAVMAQVRQEGNAASAKILIDALNKNCFEKCVPNPGSSLSSGESTCYSNCVEKYTSMWNVVSRQYISRITQHAQDHNAIHNR